MSDEPRFTKSSDNLYADLGFEEPEVELAKDQLARQIAAVIRARRLTQQQAAAIMGIDQPKVSNIMRGRLGHFSTERLMHLLNRLDLDVDIVVTPKLDTRRSARIAVRSDWDTQAGEPIAAAPSKPKRDGGVQFI